MGDDKTDEDVFRVFKKIGITIHVGRQAGTLAQYSIDGQKDVYPFLKNLLNYVITKNHG
jgi:trehalose-6-phosphatase